MLLKIQNEFQSTVIYGLIKQTFLVFFIVFLSYTALLRVVHAASALPGSSQMTEKQLLQRITALEHGFEREAQAIAALDERIAQLELKYLDVQSGIEHSAAVQTGSGPASRANDIAVMAPVQFSSAVVTPDDSGAGAGPGRSIALSLNVDALLAGGGFLLILLLFLAMWSPEKMRTVRYRGRYDRFH